MNPHREALRPKELFHTHARPRSGGRCILTSEPGTATGGPRSRGAGAPDRRRGADPARSPYAPRLSSDCPGHPLPDSLEASTLWPSGSSGAASFAQSSGVRRVPPFSSQLPPATRVSSPTKHRRSYIKRSLSTSGQDPRPAPNAEQAGAKSRTWKVGV